MPHSWCYSSWEFCTAYLLTKETVQCLRAWAELEVVTDPRHHLQHFSYSNMAERLSVFKADSSVALYPQAWPAELPSLHKPPLLLASSHHCCQLPGDSSPLVPCFFSFTLPIDCPLEIGKSLSSSPRPNWTWHPMSHWNVCETILGRYISGSQNALVKRGQHWLLRQLRGCSYLHTVGLAYSFRNCH